MRLESAIRMLEAYPQDLPIKIAGPEVLYPTGVGSYRGFYEDLAITYLANYLQKPMVMDMVRMLKGAVGTHIMVYKGGEYLVTGDTLVWISNYGQVSNYRLDGAYEDEEVVYLSGRMRGLDRTP